MKKSKRSRKRPSPHSRRKTGVALDLIEAGKNTRFQSGQSGNPSGRPRTKIFREIAREIVEMVDTKKKKQRARRIVDALVKQAEKGSLGHFKEVHRLLEEDSTQTRVELTAETSAPTAKRTPQELLAALRHIYGLAPVDPGEVIDVPASVASETVSANP